MARVRVPQADGEITIHEAGEVTAYKVTTIEDGAAGEIEVEGDHLAAVLSAIAGSVDLTPPPAKAADTKMAPAAPAPDATPPAKAGEKSKPEAPAKE